MEKDGSLDVLERIRFRFDGSYNGVYRTIPVRYRTAQGFDYRLYLDVERVSDESGAELRWKESREGDYRKLKIWVPGARDTDRTVAIRYHVVGGLRFFEDGESEGFARAHDELYWNATGDEWTVPIRSAVVRIELPDGVTGLQATAYTGGYGSRESDAEVTQLEHGFQIASSRTLQARQGLTVAVAWDPGVVKRPGVLTRAGLFLRANWILLLPLLIAGFMAWLWRAKGRDPALRPIAPWYEPPDGLTPAELGTLVDNRPDTRDVTATLVDLAVRGYLTIEEVQKNAVVKLFTGADYRFHKAKDASEWSKLRDHERELLAGLFGSGGHASAVELSELKNEFYRHMERIRDDIFRRLVSLGFYRTRPDRVQKGYLLAGAALIPLGLGGSQAVRAFGMISPVALAVAVLASALVVMGFGWFMPARTLKGTRKLEEVLGFEEFLGRVEEDRFKRMITSPDQFEEYLPYAMALGVDSKWARAFEDLVRDPPTWYVAYGGGPFRTTVFCNNLGQMSTHVGSAFTSQPRSSSSGSSGFGGGGFSGGGFGGGGGGAF